MKKTVLKNFFGTQCRGLQDKYIDDWGIGVGGSGGVRIEGGRVLKKEDFELRSQFMRKQYKWLYKNEIKDLKPSIFPSVDPPFYFSWNQYRECLPKRNPYLRNWNLCNPFDFLDPVVTFYRYNCFFFLEPNGLFYNVREGASLND